jgi:sterol desaturase/sphingolipid hydroxylase (fatty acid hydroxylase superfamily)
MANLDSLFREAMGFFARRGWQITLEATCWIAGSCLSAELLGYWLHRLLHSGLIEFLSRNHMRHHMVLYGPLQEQRSSKYRDATTDTPALGNVGLEWLLPAGILISFALVVFRVVGVPAFYQWIYFATTLLWSFVMFSYLHDVMHVEGFWMEKNKWLNHWFVSARRRHDSHHHVINDHGLMHRNFGIGFFLFDRLFGTLASCEAAFNRRGYEAAQERFKSVLRSRS